MTTSRADVGPLHDALHSPSPLGTTLDELHSKSNDFRFSYNRGPSSFFGNNCNDSVAPANSDHYSVFSFGEGSIASVAASNVANGVHHTIAHWKILVFGQLLSFFLASAGAASEELNGTCKVSVPLTQTALVMFLLMLFGARKLKGWCIGCCRKRKDDMPKSEVEDEESFYSGSEDVSRREQLHLRKNSTITNKDENQTEKDDEFTIDNEGRNPVSFEALTTKQPRIFCWGLQTIHAPLWLYFCVGLVGVEAYYLIFLSFRYTSFTFIYLVMALAIPSALVFSKILLGRTYQFTHLLGGAVCVCGILSNTLSDIEGSRNGNKEDLERHMEGDLMAIFGAILMGLEDVLSELMVRNYGGVDELFFMKGFFGFGISIVQLLILEREAVVMLFSNVGDEPCDVSTRLTFFGVYVIFQFLSGAGEVHFLSISEAALLSLSLLTSDLWATIFSIFEQGIMPSVSYYLSFFLIVSGIVLYEAGPSPIGHATPMDINIRQLRCSDVTQQQAANVIEKAGGDVEMT